jgi:Methyltransferase domain
MNHHTQATELFKEHFKDQPITGIEIGTAEGLLTKTLLMYLPNLSMIYTIDPYLYIPGGEFEASVGDQEWHNDRKRQAVVALQQYDGRYTLLCVTSDAAISLTPDKVDFVWIDGDHTVGQVIKDIDNYYPKVISNGIFGGHDCDRVVPYVKELISEQATLGDDGTWWMIKT